MWQKEDWEMPGQKNSLNKVIEVEKRAACSGIVRTMQDGERKDGVRSQRSRL